MPDKTKDYDNEPVQYCARCYSLRVVHDDTTDNDVCSVCGSTDIATATIDRWERLYENRYGHKFVDRSNDPRDSIYFKMPIAKYPDNDPRGPWQSVTANVQSGHAVPSQFYTVVSPTGIRHAPPKGRCWIYNEERMKREIAEGNIWFGKDGSSTPRVKKFLRDAKIGLTPETIWLADEVGTSDSAQKHLMSLFHDKDIIFETPKTEELLKRIIEIATNEGDYVLDCYVGSGTTISTAHKLNRHYVGIEIGSQMSEFVVKRMNQVIAGENGGISKIVSWHGGGEFAFLRL